MYVSSPLCSHVFASRRAESFPGLRYNGYLHLLFARKVFTHVIFICSGYLLCANGPMSGRFYCSICPMYRSLSFQAASALSVQFLVLVVLRLLVNPLGGMLSYGTLMSIPATPIPNHRFGSSLHSQFSPVCGGIRIPVTLD